MPTGGLASWLVPLLWNTAASYATSAITNKLFGAKTKSSSPTYTLGALQTQTNSGLVMPLTYGRVKCAGNQIWASPSGTVQSRIISFGLGKIKGFSSVCIDDLLIDDGPIFRVSNSLYADATIRITHTFVLTALILYANGQSYSLILSFANEITTITELISAIRKYPGWEVDDVISTSNKLSEIKLLDITNCYNNPTGVIVNGLSGCSYTAYLGDGEQLIDDRVTGATQEDKAKLVGGLKYDAYLAITATASDRISNFNVTAIVEGRIVRIYDTMTTYTEKWSDNPAWCELDFKTSVDGCGMEHSSIDLQMYLTAGNYYDQLVNGKKRFTLNLILDEKKTRQDWLTEIFSTCRSYPTYQRGLHGILVDKPEEVSQVFNVKPDESIETWWQDNAEDIERLQIEYIDPDYEYTKVVAQADRTQLPGETSQFRNKIPLTKKKSIYGINNFVQASREAWFHLNKAQTCPEWIQYTTNKKALNRSIGDVVGIWNPITEVTEPGLSYKRYRIMTMNEPQENNITMVMQEYNPNLYGDTMGSVAPIINITKLPNPASAPLDVTNLDAEEHSRDQGNGVVLNDLYVTFSPPDYQFYSHADVYIKSDNPSADELIDIPEELMSLPYDQIADALQSWKFISTAIDKIVIPNLIKGQTYSIKVVSVSKNYNFKATFDTAPVIKRTIIGKTLQPYTPTGLQVIITDIAQVSWNTPSQTDVDFSEVRLDANAGNDTGKLAKTTANKTVVTLPSRSGTVYLYAHNTADKYSDPAWMQYNKPAPIMPSNVQITDIFQGLVITCDALPTYCLGINVHINDGTGDKVYFDQNNSHNFKTTGGIFEIRVAYVDLFGEGALSAVISKVVKATVDPELIAAESLSLAMMDPIMKDAVTKANAAATKLSVDQVQTSLDGAKTDISNSQSDISAAKTRLSTVEGIATSQGSSIDTLNNQVAIKANQVDLDTTKGRVATTEASLITQAGQIALKAAQSIVDVLTGRIATAESSIVTQAGQIALKAAQSLVDTLTNRVTNAEGSIVTQAGQIALKAAQSVVDALASTVTNNKAAIDITTASITNTVTSNKNTQDGVNTGLVAQQTIQAGQITQVVSDLGAANTVIAQNTDAIQLRALSANLISLLNVCPEAVTILSKLIHISGDTLFDDNVLVEKMFSADSISARAMTSEALTLVSGGNVLTAGAVKLDSTGMTLTNTTGYNKFDSRGITWVDASGNQNGSVRRTIQGMATSGTYIPLNWINSPQVLFSPYNMLTSNSSNFTRMLLIPESVTASGFRVRGYFQTSGGTNGAFANYNYNMGVPFTNVILGTTPAGTCQINCYFYNNSHSNQSTWTIAFYYRMLGTTTWIQGGTFGFGGGYRTGSTGITTTISPTQLGIPAQFEVMATMIANGGSYAEGTGYIAISYVSGANNIEDTSSQIAYIAMESS